MARKTLVGWKNNKNNFSMNIWSVLEINENYHEFRFEDVGKSGYNTDTSIE